MSLEDVTLSERNQPRENKYCAIPLTGGPQSGQIHRDRRRMVGRGAGGGQLVFNGGRVSVSREKKSHRD